MQELDLDVAGEFLVMAATLIHIKSKMLLPRPETAAGVEGEVEDPRDALVRRLLEHQKFKAAAGLLHEREQLRAAQWLRPDGRVAELAGDDYEPELEVDLFSLMNAFQAVVQRLKQRPKVLLPPEEIPVELRIEQLLARLSETEAMRLRGSVRRRRASQRPDRHVSGAAGNDSLEAGEGLPVRQLRPDSRLQARAAGRRAASDWRPGGKSWLTRKTGRTAGGPRADRQDGPDARAQDRQDGLEGQEGQDRREADAEIQDGESLPKRGAAELKAILEALIFASPDPMTPKAMCKLLDTEPKEDVLAALAELKQDYEQRPGGLQLVEVAGGYQIVTRSDLHEWVRRLFHERTTQKLTVQALETLAVIAYRQPITAAEITEVRGVNTSGVLNTLLERHLIKIVGRKASSAARSSTRRRRNS